MCPMVNSWSIVIFGTVVDADAAFTTGIGGGVRFFTTVTAFGGDGVFRGDSTGLRDARLCFAGFFRRTVTFGCSGFGGDVRDGDGDGDFERNWTIDSVAVRMAFFRNARIRDFGVEVSLMIDTLTQQ